MDAPPVFGRFGVLEILGSGPRGRVLKVLDQSTGELRALKVLLDDSVNAPLFKEFQTFAGVAHPGIIPHIDAGHDATGLSFVVYGYVSGVTLERAALEARPLREGLEHLRQALLGLKALHEAGLVHGNLKLTNLLLERPRERGPGRIYLLDAGLEPPVTPDPRGRLAIAPECLDGDRVGVRADLYSLGVVFYEALTGVSPFSSAGGVALAQEKRRGRAAPPSQARLEITAHLDALFLALLAPDPAQRPGSAEEVLRSMDAMDEEPTAPASTRSDLILPLMGRERALAAMDEAIEGLRAGRGQVLVFAGGSGTGKSRILQEMRLRLRKAGIPMQSTRGRGADRPMGPMRRLVAPLLEEHGGEAGLEPYLPALYPYWPRFSVKPLRPLGTLDLRGRGTALPLAQADRLASFLLEVPEPPRALLVDDAHQCALDLQRVLCQLALRLPERPFLLAFAVDPSLLGGEAPLSRLLMEIPLTRVELTGLSQGQVMGLVQELFGRVEGLERLQEAVYDWSAGNLSRMEFYLRQLMGQRVLYQRGEAWSFQASRLSLARETLPPPGVSLEYALLFGLDEESRLILRAIAVLGSCRPMEIGIALGGRLDEGQLAGGLAFLSHRSLLRGRGREPSYDLVYPSQRARLSQEVDAVDRATWHRRLADHWAQVRGRGAEGERARAHHWLKGGEDLKALSPGIAYLDHLEQSWRAEEALAWVGWLLGLRGIGARQLFELRERGVRLALRFGELRVARELAGPLGEPGFGAELPDLEWRSEWLRGLICLRSSAYEEARTHLEAACAWLPDEASQAERAALLTACALSRMLTGRPEMAERLAEETLDRFKGSESVDVQREVVSLWALRSNLAWIRGRSEEAEAIALKGFGAVEAFLRRFPEAREALEGDLGHLSFMRANACYYQGRYGDGIQSALEAASRFERGGDLAFEARCYHLAGLSNVMTGDYPEATRHFETLQDVALRAGADADRAQALSQLGVLYRVAGRLERAVDTLEASLALARRLKDRRLVGQVQGNLGEAWHRRGDLKLARRHYEEAVETLQYTSKRDLLENLRRLLELAFDEGKLRGFEVRVAEALTLARSQDRRTEEGNLLSLLGVYAARMGRTREAFDHFRAGERALREAGALYALGRLKLRQGQTYLDMGAASEAEAALRVAEETFRRLGAEPDLEQVHEVLRQLEEKAQGNTQVYKKLQLLLEVNRSLTAVRDIEKLLDLMVDKAIDLTGAERGFVLLFDAQGARTLHSARHMKREEIDGQDAQVSQTVLDRVREGMAPVMVTNVDRDAMLRGQKSVVSLGLRAIMAAPLKRGEELLGILYLDSSRPLEEFYHRDQSLIEALADAAAIAVENAQLVQSLRRKNELMSILAHEFRSPVTSTLLFVRQLLRRSEGALGSALETDRTSLEGIASQGERLSRMIDNILQLSRMEADQVAWEMAPVDVGEIARRAVAELGPLGAERGVRLRAYVALGKLQTWGNGDRLIQVCTNLLVNGIKVSPEGEDVTLRVRAVSGPARPEGGRAAGRERWERPSIPQGFRLSETRHIEVEVGDRGPGLAAEEQERIFERFAQAGDARSRAQGTGLGLSISRGIVKEHGGRIWVENLRGPAQEAPLPEEAPTDLIPRERMAQILAGEITDPGLSGTAPTPEGARPPRGTIILGASFRFTLPLLEPEA